MSYWCTIDWPKEKRVVTFDYITAQGDTTSTSANTFQRYKTQKEVVREGINSTQICFCFFFVFYLC